MTAPRERNERKSREGDWHAYAEDMRQLGRALHDVRGQLDENRRLLEAIFEAVAGEDSECTSLYDDLYELDRDVELDQGYGAWSG